MNYSKNLSEVHANDLNIACDKFSRLIKKKLGFILHADGYTERLTHRGLIPSFSQCTKKGGNFLKLSTSNANKELVLSIQMTCTSKPIYVSY